MEIDIIYNLYASIAFNLFYLVKKWVKIYLYLYIYIYIYDKKKTNTKTLNYNDDTIN